MLPSTWPIVAACVLTAWLGWRRRLPPRPALTGLAVGSAMIVLYVAYAIGSGVATGAAELLLIQRLPPGSYFVVIGYLVIAYCAGSLIKLPSRS